MEKDNDNNNDLSTAICLMLLIMLFIMSCHKRNQFQREAIERGCAEYNPTNGEWQWKK